MKQKMIEAMAWYAHDKGGDFQGMLDAALSVAADPDNWTEEMANAARMGNHYAQEFAFVISHIKGLPS